jgi:hypothetical protein
MVTQNDESTQVKIVPNTDPNLRAVVMGIGKETDVRVTCQELRIVAWAFYYNDQTGDFDKTPQPLFAPHLSESWMLKRVMVFYDKDTDFHWATYTEFLSRAAAMDYALEHLKKYAALERKAEEAAKAESKARSKAAKSRAKSKTKRTAAPEAVQ